MNELQVNTLPEYVPTPQELIDIFPRLPPPDKVNNNILCVPVQAKVNEKVGDEGFHVIIPQRTVSVGKIEFIKCREIKDGKPIFVWAYNGLVKQQ